MISSLLHYRYIFPASLPLQYLRWLDWIFLGGYLPSLSINYVAKSKDREKRLPQLYYIKMKFLMIWVLSQSESRWQRNDAITFFIYLCVSLYQEFVPAIIASIMAKFEQILWERFRNILKQSFKHHKSSEIACYLGNCSGQSWVRRILLICIQLPLFQSLHIIWSMPTNFAFFKKLPDKFFCNFENPESNHP